VETADILMRICRFDKNRLGVVEGEKLFDVTEALDILPNYRWPLPHGDALILHLSPLLDRILALRPTAAMLAVADVQLLSPVANPSKIIAAPVNYMKHFDEARADSGINYGADIKTIDDYGLFLKSNTSLVGAGQAVVLPNLDRRMDHEVELAVIIGLEGAHIPPVKALDHVAGYSIALDMSIRGTEDRSWRKSFDTFSVLGPWLVTRDEVPDPSSLDLDISVNGQRRQSSNTRALIFDVPKLISYASSAYRLYPGDIIMTGTPEGVGPVDPGDIMECHVQGVGRMSVRVEQ
jgi:2-keto-4-pentenoate hydratase/2-oxohepta-3-ene-1,7-dioic acid hydratase in catechol pathway